MRLVDLQLALPAILFATLIASVFGASLRNVIIVIIMVGWAGYARLARAQVLTLREREFVTAAKAFGASDRRIALRHLLPNLLDTILILATLEVYAVRCNLKCEAVLEIRTLFTWAHGDGCSSIWHGSQFLLARATCRLFGLVDRHWRLSPAHSRDCTLCAG